MKSEIWHAIEEPCKAMDSRIYLGLNAKVFLSNTIYQTASETYTLYNLPKGQIWFNDVNNKCSGCSRPPLILPVFSANIPPSCFNLELQVSTPIVCSSSAWMVKFEAVLPFWPAEITWQLTFCPQHFQASQNDERCVQIQRMENV